MKSVPPWAEEEEPREVAAGAAPAQTIHLALGRRAMGGGYEIGDESMIDVLARRDDPDARAVVAANMNAGWYFLGLACVVALAVFAILTDVLFGPAARNVVVAVFAALTFFCLAGNATILWRRYYYIGRARRLAQRYGVTNARYVSAMNRALPRNSSLIGQSIVAILTFVIVLSSV